jgi:hypothetical protein
MRRKARRASGAFRVVVFQEDGWLCAQCLEFDLAVQAKSLPQLYRRLHRLITSHVAVRRAHSLPPFRDLPRAPAKYWQMFEESKIPLPPQLVHFPEIKRPVVIPFPEFRVATASAE